MGLAPKPPLHERMVRWKHEDRELVEMQPNMVGTRYGMSSTTMERTYELDWEEASIVQRALALAIDKEADGVKANKGSHFLLPYAAHLFKYAELMMRIREQFDPQKEPRTTEEHGG